ncbi:hypothetical protein WICPIJ_009786 [Wickerhamomyces pijperi]|uniref:Uncharacterized protein n=1 Tax=Wickerhamomyces pijperi TaxID=599730 RepID=A0A9P8TBH2_WICPI|nr:hypothetical protein WICPIJ_009786 [Wickerhamomyces pijperi]
MPSVRSLFSKAILEQCNNSAINSHTLNRSNPKGSNSVWIWLRYLLEHKPESVKMSLKSPRDSEKSRSKVPSKQVRTNGVLIDGVYDPCWDINLVRGDDSQKKVHDYGDIDMFEEIVHETNSLSILTTDSESSAICSLASKYSELELDDPTDTETSRLSCGVSRYSPVSASAPAPAAGADSVNVFESSSSSPSPISTS